jgi:DedD protein
MAKAQTEDELNLRRKARRRLIGAVAFTLAVVVILPMVLDREPRPTGRDIDLRIPSPDKAGEFVPGTAVPGGPGVVPPAASAVVPAPVPATAVKAAPAQAPEAKKPAAIQQAAPGKASAHKPAEPAKPAADAGKPASEEAYVAQVGAYANPGTAKQELNKLKKWGFKAYTEKSGDKIRVRVGPYPDRDKAEKVGKLLEKHGLHPVILSAK